MGCATMPRMTTLARAVKLYINSDLPGGRNALLDGTTSNEIKQAPSFMQGDRFALRLYFRTPVFGAASTATDLESDYSLVLSGKLNGTLKTSQELFRVSDWVKGSDYYEGTLDLATAALDAAMAASDGDEIDVAMDIEYRDTINSERQTYRANVVVFRQVYSGGIAPSSLSTSYLQSPDGSTWQLTMDDEGGLAIAKIGADQRNPGFVTLSSANFVTTGGYGFQLVIDDEGAITTRRIQ